MRLFSLKNTENQEDTEKMIHQLIGGDQAVARILLSLMDRVEMVDPDNLYGSFYPLVVFEKLSMRGSQISSLYHHVCRGDDVGVLACLNAVEQGVISFADLQSAITDQRAIDTDFLLQQVQQKIPEFGLLL